MNLKTAKTIRIIAIVLMGLTAAMNVLGGIGTVCAAFLTKDYPPMWVLMDYQWLYQSLMITTIIIGIFGFFALRKLVRGNPTAYRYTIITLVIGTVLAGIQFYASSVIRGKAVPANVKFYVNAFTLIIFVVLNFPKIKKWIDFSKPLKKTDQAKAGGLTSFVAGVIVLTVFIWVGPSHSYMGANWVMDFAIPILAAGSLLVIGGISSMIWGTLKAQLPEGKIEALPIE